MGMKKPAAIARGGLLGLAGPCSIVVVLWLLFLPPMPLYAQQTSLLLFHR
jgi:hypothetical protein